MEQSEIIALARTLAGVAVQTASEEDGAPEAAWGDSFFFYDPSATGDEANRRFPFATIVIHDYEGFDEQSELDRPGVFRVNFWVSKQIAAELTARADDEAVDYAALDELIPHPIYAAQSWVSIVSPGERTAGLVPQLLTEAYDRAVERHERRSDGGED